MIASIAAGAASGMLSQLMSALSPSSSSTSTTAAAVSAFQQAIPQLDGAATSSPPANPLSGAMLASLVSLQANPAQSSSNPLDSLFSAMDSDGDGEVSQTEMESYVEDKGGTQQQADALFSALDQNGASGISETRMSDALSQSQASQGAHRHHQRHHSHSDAGSSADDVANGLLQAMDGNDDGQISESEFSSFVTADGGTAAEAQNDFDALDTSGSGSLTSADFAKAWQSYQASAQSANAISLLDRMAQSIGGSPTSVMA
ncbi:MAG: EF-hand domain-containing protein [Rhizomicrobium sp.]